MVGAPRLRPRRPLPAGVRRGRRRSRRHRVARRPRAAAVHDQGDAARQLPVRHVRGAARGRRTPPRVERHDRQADRRRLHPRRPRHVGRRRRPLDPRGRRTPRDDPAQRLRLRPVHRRPRCARRCRAARLHRRAGLGWDDAAAGAADPRLRARRHHGDAVLHALDHRRARGAGRRPALDVAQGRDLRRRAVDQRHAPRGRGADGHARGRHLRPVRGDRARRGERVRGDQGRAARVGGPLLPRGHRPRDRRGAARRRGGRAGLHHADQAGDAGHPLPHPRPDPAAAGHRAQRCGGWRRSPVAPTT